MGGAAKITYDYSNQNRVNIFIIKTMSPLNQTVLLLLNICLMQMVTGWALCSWKRGKMVENRNKIHSYMEYSSGWNGE